MAFKQLFIAFAAFVVFSIMACDRLYGAQSGEPCETATYRPRCTDGDAIRCVGASDCSQHDCSGIGCECYEYAHISRQYCVENGQHCVVDHDGSRCD
jgi:hypothetical protein